MLGNKVKLYLYVHAIWMLGGKLLSVKYEQFCPLKPVSDFANSWLKLLQTISGGKSLNLSCTNQDEYTVTTHLLYARVEIEVLTVVSSWLRY